MLWIKTGSKKLNKRQRVLTSIVSAFVILTMVLALVFIPSQKPSAGASLFAEWTTKADFESNASTTTDATTVSQADTTSSSGDVRLIQSEKQPTITAGYYHSLVLKSDGTVWATGFNLWGGLGLGDTANRTSFTQTSLTGVTAVVGSVHSLALKSDGTVWATGINSVGQLGLGDTANRTSFTQTSLTGITAIAAGYYHSLALKSDGTVWATGSNSYGQLGLGDTANRTSFTQTSLTGVTAIAAGYYHSLALKSDGTVWATGYNGYGELGLGDTATRTSFTQTSLTGVTAVAGGGYGGQTHSLALKSDGTVWATGSNSYGQLGLGDTATRTSFTQTSLIGVTAIAGGLAHSLALKSDGTVWGTGHSNSDELGLGGTFSSRTSFTQTPLTGVRQPITYYYPGTIGGTGTDVGLRTNAGSGVKAKWSSVTFNSGVLASGQAVKFAVRTSDDGSTWSAPLGKDGNAIDWTTGTGNYLGQAYGENVNSTISGVSASRYLDIVVRLESDGSNTPILNDIRLDYDTIDPANSSDLSIYRNDGTTQISVPDANGGWTNETNVKVKINNMSGLSNTSTLTPEVEAKAVGTAFDGTSTTLGSAVAYSGSAVNGEVTLTGLSVGTAYHFRVRLKDDLNRVSAWTNFNNNNKAFTIEQTSPTGSVVVRRTKTYQIAATNDDAQAISISVQPTDVSHYLGQSGAWYWRSFYRWQIDIPKGSTINNAYIKLDAGSTDSTAFTSQIRLLDYDSSPEFTSNPYNWSTAAGSVGWTFKPWTFQQNYTSPDISTLVQNYIDRTGYDEGKYIGLRQDEGDAGTDEKRVIQSYDTLNGGDPPTLVVGYTPPSGDYTTSTSATLDLSSATDPGTVASGVDKVMASEDSSFTDTLQGDTTWQNYSSSYPFTLSSGDGNKTVYVKFKDKAGNVGNGKVFTTQADFEAATGTNIDTTSSSGDVKIVGVDTGTGALGNQTISTTQNISSYGGGNFNNLTITSTGTLIADPSTAIDIKVKGTLNVQTGGKIDVTGKGYTGGGPGQNGNGPGGGGKSTGNIKGGGGAGYGGAGGSGNGNSGSGGIAYNTSFPNFGSGGGSSWSGNAGGDGGGSIKIQANAIVLDGQIIADGNNGSTSSTNGAGGGSGGSIYIKTNSSFNTTGISAKGGNGGTPSGSSGYGGGGGGGRVTINGTVTGTPTVSGGLKGGTGAVNGNAGVYLNSSSIYETLGTLGSTGTGLRVGSPTGAVNKWTSLNWSASGLSATYKIKLQARAADTWGNGSTGYMPLDTNSTSNTVWTELTSGTTGTINITNTNLVTTPTKTLEIRAELVGDGANTPTLSDLTVGYATTDTITLDTTKPSDPTVSAYKDASKAASITGGNTWYNTASGSATPYFEWPAATDAGSGLSGYNVYFGTNASATAQNDGTFQTEKNYSASTLTSGQVYYLKVAAKDNAGLFSNTEASFTYKYDNVPPTISSSTVSASTTDSAKVAVSWTKPTDDADAVGGGAVSYDVYRKHSTDPDIDSFYTKLNTDPVGALSYDDTTTNANYMYNYKIKATDAASNGSGFSSKSNDGYLKDTIAPTEPSNPVATAQANGTSNILTWGQSLDNVAVSGYKIYRTTDGLSSLPGEAGSNYTLIANVAATPTSYTDSGLVDNTRYYYRIQAYDAATPANISNASENGVTPPTATDITPDVTNPTAVTGLNGNATAFDTIALSWNAAQDKSNDGTSAGTGIDHYNIYRSTDGVSYPPTPTAQALNSNFTDTGLSEYTQYWYKITAVDKATPAALESNPAYVSSIRTYQASAPTSPANLSATSADGDPKAANSVVGKQIIFSFLGSASRYATITTYKVYKIKGSSSQQFLTNSDWAAAPVIKTFNSADVGPATGGIINSVSYNDVDTKTYTVTDNNIQDGIYYYYKVRATDDAPIAEGGPFSTLTGTNANVKVPDITPPSVPSTIQVIDLYNPIFKSYPRLTVNWPNIAEAQDLTGQSDFKEYRLYRSTDGNTWGSPIYTGSINYYVDEALSNVTYYYKVTSTDTFVHDLGGGQTKNNESSGVISSGTNPSSIDKVAPAILSVSKNEGVSSTTVKFSTDEAARAYIEYGKTTDYNNTSGRPGSRTSHSINLINLKPNTTYNYRLAATDSSGNKVTGSNRTFKTNRFSVSKVKVVTSVSSALVTWRTNEASDSFVKYGNKNINEKVAGSDEITKKHVVKITNLRPNATYKFKVKSKDAYNNIVIKSNNAKTFQTKPFKIANVSTDVSTNSTTVIWKTNVAATSLVEYKGPDDSVSQIAGDAKLTKKHKVDIKNLKVSTTYSFKLKSRDRDDNIANSSLLSFRTRSLSEGYTVDPKVSKLDELELTATSAKINWTTEGETSSWVEYGSSKSLGKTAGNDTLTVDHIVTLEGLTPGTIYYYRVKGEDVDGNKYQSSILFFTALVNPKITTKPKVETTNDTATITWTTNTDTDSIIEYGLTSKYGDSMGSGVLTKTHEVEIKGLAQNTSYHFRVGGVDKFSNKVVGGDTLLKTNKDTTGPVISKVRNEILRSSDEEGKEIISVIVNFTTNEEATSYIEYAEGISMASYNKKTKTSFLNLSHSTLIENLKPSTTYHYRVVTKDKYGNKTKSLDKTILTPKESETVLQKIIKVLEDTFSWVSNLKDYMTQTAKNNNPVDLFNQ